jgi:hypothetical protein
VRYSEEEEKKGRMNKITNSSFEYPENKMLFILKRYLGRFTLIFASDVIVLQRFLWVYAVRAPSVVFVRNRLHAKYAFTVSAACRKYSAVYGFWPV